MFVIVKHTLEWNGELYVIKRTLKESSIDEKFTQEYKEYIGADTVLKKNGVYYFIEKIDEAQIIEEEESELGKVIES
jgi:hypothetical protein